MRVMSRRMIISQWCSGGSIFLTINDPRTGRFSFDNMQPESYATQAKKRHSVLCGVGDRPQRTNLDHLPGIDQ